MAHNLGNFRSPVLAEPRLIPGGSTNLIQTPLGNVRSNQIVSSVPPPLPPPLNGQSNSYSYGGGSPYMGYNSYNSYSPMYGGYGSGGLGGYGGYGGFGSGFGSYGGYGSYNRYGGMNPYDPETRFIQLAEESSRPAFQSIESLVGAIGNIAAMLDSTFFALTSSFRAILGVAANFGRLRGVFAQFWSTFAIFRGLNWIYRKLLYMLKVSNIDPSSEAFKEAFAAAQKGLQTDPQQKRKPSPWPVVAFLGFIFTAPYLIMKLLSTVSNSAVEESRYPQTWVRPIKSTAVYSFQGRNPEELSIRAGQTVLVAPKEVQNTHKLMSSGWALATVDGRTSGLIPIQYVQGPNQINREAPVVPNSNIVNEFPKEWNLPVEGETLEQVQVPAAPAVDSSVSVSAPVATESTGECEASESVKES